MDVKDKIMKALFQELDPEYVRLEDDDGISGFVVSRQFENMSSLDRQGRIEDILRKTSLVQEERRQILMIAGLTPVEYDAVGTRIRIQTVKQRAKGSVEVVVDGGLSDAEYVRRVLDKQKGVRTTKAKPIKNGVGSLVSFLAKGSEANPLTIRKAIRVLKKDPYIHLLSTE